MKGNGPKIVFSDFDGTLTQGETLGVSFFDVLSEIARLRSELVIVTGRSVSWAHFLLTHFPVLKAVISEGGGTLTMREKIEPVDYPVISEQDAAKLAGIARDVVKNFPKLKLTTDSFGRHADRAIDLHLLSDAKLKNDVEAFLSGAGAEHSCSSVHLNFWVGNFSKATTSLDFLKKHRSGVTKEECLFFGDGLNDQSMFAAFPKSVGVSNIAPILSKFSPPPTVVLKGPENAGPLGVVAYLKSLS